MLTYQAAYSDGENGWVVGEVLDFPGVVSQGQGLEEARRMLASALVDLAETVILQGDPLPLPEGTSRPDPDADLIEPIHLLLDAASVVRITPERMGV